MVVPCSRMISLSSHDVMSSSLVLRFAGKDTHTRLAWLMDQGLLPLPAHQAHGSFYARVRRLKCGIDPRTGTATAPSLRNTIEQVLGQVLVNAAVCHRSHQRPNNGRGNRTALHAHRPVGCTKLRGQRFAGFGLTVGPGRPVVPDGRRLAAAGLGGRAAPDGGGRAGGAGCRRSTRRCRP